MKCFFLVLVILSLSEYSLGEDVPVHSHLKILFHGYDLDDFPFIHQKDLAVEKQKLLGNLLVTFPKLNTLNKAQLVHTLKKFQIEFSPHPNVDFEEICIEGSSGGGWNNLDSDIVVNSIRNYPLRSVLYFRGIDFGIGTSGVILYKAKSGVSFEIEGGSDVLIDVNRASINLNSRRFKQNQEQLTRFFKSFHAGEQRMIGHMIIEFLRKSSERWGGGDDEKNKRTASKYRELFNLSVYELTFRNNIFEVLKLQGKEKFFEKIKEEYEKLKEEKKRMLSILQKEVDEVGSSVFKINQIYEGILSDIRGIEFQYAKVLEQIQEAKSVVTNVDEFISILLSRQNQRSNLSDPVSIKITGVNNTPNTVRTSSSFHKKKIKTLEYLLPAYL